MKYRLFLQAEAASFLFSLTKEQRHRLLIRLEAICDYPSHQSQYTYHDDRGRRIDGCVAAKHAIEWWEDTADGDLKVIAISWADGHGRRAS
jgi:hypothetical protein